jgi:hypothetical protein
LFLLASLTGFNPPDPVAGEGDRRFFLTAGTVRPPDR